MKKTLIILIMLLFTLTLVSCNDPQYTYYKTPYEEPEKVPLKVDSLIIEDIFGDEQTITSDTPFYDLLLYIDFTFNNHEIAYDRENIFDIKYKLGDNDEIHTTGVLYVRDSYSSLWNLETLDKDGNIFKFQKYDFLKHNVSELDENDIYMEEHNYHLFSYKDEFAMNGYDRLSYKGETSSQRYVADYPIWPKEGTKFSEMFVSTYNFIRMFDTFKLFEKYEEFNYNSVNYNLEENVIRTITLYDEYILLEQSSPFLGLPIGPKEIQYAYYKNCLGNQCMVTQTVRYNLELRHIDFVSIKGESMSTFLAPNTKLELDISVHINPISHEQYNIKRDKLIDYVQKNAK